MSVTSFRRLVAKVGSMPLLCIIVSNNLFIKIPPVVLVLPFHGGRGRFTLGCVSIKLLLGTTSSTRETHTLVETVLSRLIE